MVGGGVCSAWPGHETGVSVLGPGLAACFWARSRVGGGVLVGRVICSAWPGHESGVSGLGPGLAACSWARGWSSGSYSVTVPGGNGGIILCTMVFGSWSLTDLGQSTFIVVDCRANPGLGVSGLLHGWLLGLALHPWTSLRLGLLLASGQLVSWSSSWAWWWSWSAWPMRLSPVVWSSSVSVPAMWDVKGWTMLFM